MHHAHSPDDFYPLAKWLTSIYKLDNGLSDNRQLTLNQFQGYPNDLDRNGQPSIATIELS